MLMQSVWLGVVVDVERFAAGVFERDAHTEREHRKDADRDESDLPGLEWIAVVLLHHPESCETRVVL